MKKKAIALSLSKGFTPILILIIILVLGGIGFVAMQSFQPKPLVTPTPNLSRDESLKDWNIFQDSRYLFSFNYPSTWTVENDTPDLSPLLIKDGNGETVIRINTSVNLTLIGLSPPCKPPDCSLETVGGNIGNILVEYREQTGYSLISKNDTRGIIFWLEKVTPKTKRAFHKILSTFQFIEAAAKYSCQSNSDCTKQSTCSEICVHTSWLKDNPHTGPACGIPWQYGCKCVNNKCISG